MVYRRFCRETLQWHRCAAVLASIGITLLLMGCGGDGSATVPAASSRVQIVPVTGTVAGGGYGTWLQRSWQIPFSSQTFPPCGTTESDGQRVGLLSLANASDAASTCAEPPGRPLYVTMASVECSSFPGNHGTFGPDHGKGPLTSGPQLQACARSEFEGTTMSATVDGRSVNAYALVVTTKVFPIDVVVNDSIGSPGGSGHAVAAARGGGVLLTGLTAGTLVIRLNGKIDGQSSTNTLTVHVER